MSRRRVLDLLVSNGEISASWLAGRVPISRQAVFKHLVVLEQAGLISRRRQGREVLYQVEADRLDQAARAMTDLAAQWDRRLAAIKRLAEAAHGKTRREEKAVPRETVMQDARRGRARASAPRQDTPIISAQLSSDAVAAWA